MSTFFFLSSVAVLLASADEQLFGDPYRTDANSVVPNPTFAAMTSPNSVAISYQGFAQVPSAPSSSSRLLFSVRPSSSDQYALPKVYIADNAYLVANISTTDGIETFVGPRVPFDAWFAFAIAIANGNVGSRYVLLYVSYMNVSASVAEQYVLRNNMLPSSTSLALAPTLSPSSSDPVPVYLTSLRVIGSALTQSGLDYYILLNPPSTYFWQVGTELGVFGFQASANVSCVDDGLVIGVRQAYFGRPIGVWPRLSPGPACNADSAVTMATVSNACLNQRWCIVPQSTADYGVDPCPSHSKSVAVSMTCSTSAIAPWPQSSFAPTSTSTAPAWSSVSNWPPDSGSRAVIASSPVPSPSNEILSHPRSSRFPGTSSRSTSLSRKASNPNGWQLSLTIFLNTLGISSTMRSSLISAFINDMGSALYVPPARFAMVEFQQQTASSTLLSFVVLPNATDPDASAVTASFSRQIQIPGSELRSATLLMYAGEPPVAVQTIGLRVVNCGADLYVISPNACPTVLFSSEAPTTKTQTYMLIIGLCLLGLMIAGIVAGLHWRSRKKQRIRSRYTGSDSQAMVAVPVNKSLYPVHPSFVSIGGMYPEGQMAPSPRACSAHPMSEGQIVLPSLNDLQLPKSPRLKDEPGRRKRSRIERSPSRMKRSPSRLRSPPRVKFALGDAYNDDSDFGPL